MNNSDGCEYCRTGAFAFLKTPSEIMGNGAERFILVGVGEDGFLHIERKTVRKHTMDIDYLGKGKINCCPMCGRKLSDGKIIKTEDTE